MAVIHCKAGKGRTGVMIAAYLVFAYHYNRLSEKFNEFKELAGFITPEER